MITIVNSFAFPVFFSTTELNASTNDKMPLIESGWSSDQDDWLRSLWYKSSIVLVNKAAFDAIANNSIARAAWCGKVAMFDPALKSVDPTTGKTVYSAILVLNTEGDPVRIEI